ncbi:MAG: hypothetical protein IT210_03970 [Armatimonadetes bacterium]|nr:hypothetical protein [Armatimonadota bacterium]
MRSALAEEADLGVVTPGAAAKLRKRRISQVRERIETVLSQLWRAFVDRVFFRSWAGLWSAIQRKLLAYNLCQQGIISH